jgi:hypothetical protein
MPEPPDKLSEGHDPFCSLAKMAKLIAVRIRPPGEPLRTTTDKVRKRLSYATKKGELRTLGTGPGLYYLPHAIAWSQEKWPGKLNDLRTEPPDPAASKEFLQEDPWKFLVPSDLRRCQEVLGEALLENYLLRTKLTRARAEIHRLTPIMKKYEQICEKNARSAKLPRKGSL